MAGKLETCWHCGSVMDTYEGHRDACPALTARDHATFMLSQGYRRCSPSEFGLFEPGLVKNNIGMWEPTKYSSYNTVVEFWVESWVFDVIALFPKAQRMEVTLRAKGNKDLRAALAAERDMLRQGRRHMNYYTQRALQEKVYGK